MVATPPTLIDPPNVLINGPHRCRWCGDNKVAVGDTFICNHCDLISCRPSSCPTCAIVRHPSNEGTNS